MRHFVEFFDGRRFFTETETRGLAERSVDEALGLMPEYTYGFRIWDVAEEVRVPDAPKGVTFQPMYDRLDQSGIYFPGGELLTLDNVSLLAVRDPDQYKILHSNMFHNGWLYAVRTRSGNIVKFDIEKDQIL